MREFVMTNPLSSRYVTYLLRGIKWILIVTGSFVGLVIAILIASQVFHMWWDSYGAFRGKSFNATVWFEPTPHKSPCYRAGMASDIMNRFLTRDMMREDVVLQLVAPAGNATEQHYQYCLGPCGGDSGGGGTLHVYFDSSGHYSHSEIHL